MAGGKFIGFMERLFCFHLPSASIARGRFINCLARLFCFTCCGENLPSDTQSIAHGDHTDENLPSSPLALPLRNRTDENMASHPRPFPPCGVHTRNATGPCTCGLDTLRDGSFDFHEIEVKFRAALLIDELSKEQSEADFSGKETEISTDCIQEEEHSIGAARIFSYDEIHEAVHYFDPVRKIGEGGYSTVYLGKLKDGQMVAVKVLHDYNRDEWPMYMMEINLFCSLRHQNLVRLYGCTSGSQELILVYEYMSNGSVAEHLHGHRKTSSRVLTWHLRIQIAIETAEGIAYLHFKPGHYFQPGRQSIIHCDIKTDNILLDDTFHVKVGDFGLSTPYNSSRRGTLGYLDPEYDKGYRLTDKSDVYSFGVVLLELISGQKAVDVNRNDIYLVSLALKMITNKELEQLVDPNLEYQPDSEAGRMINQVAELACLCLQLERDKRPSMAEVLWNLKKIRDNKNPDIEHVDNSPPAQTLTFDLSKMVPLSRRLFEEMGGTEFLEKVRSSYGHKLSTVVLFLSFVKPHTNAPVNDNSPWGTSCGCRLYLQNNRILEGLTTSPCFFGKFFSYIVGLTCLNDMPLHVTQRIIDNILTLAWMSRMEQTQ